MMGLLLVTLLNLLALKGAKHVERSKMLGQEQSLSRRGSSNTMGGEIYFNLYHQNGENSTSKAHQWKTMEDFKLPNKSAIKVIIHGWTDSAQSPWVLEMQDVMGGTNRWNVIAMNWAPISYGSFRDAYEQTDLVAEKLAEFTTELIRSNSLPFHRVHYIGHGLGALIAIQAAYKITARTNKRISRLTGLDPTLRSLAYKEISKELKGIAKFVDVIHTNGGEFGTLQPIGHVDFYPNGGKLQPGCSSSICSHTRACEYWIASIMNAHAFGAYNYKQWCDYIAGRYSKLIAHPMGIAANPTMPWGPYFLETTDSPPHVIANHNLIRK